MQASYKPGRTEHYLKLKYTTIWNKTYLNTVKQSSFYTN